MPSMSRLAVTIWVKPMFLSPDEASVRPRRIRMQRTAFHAATLTNLSAN
jgi:hypothetical protein